MGLTITKKKIAAGLFVALICLLSLVFLLPPLLINHPVIKNRIVLEAERLLQADVSIKRMTMGFFSRPHVDFLGVQLSLSDGTNISIEHIELYVALTTLLSGDVESDYMVIQSPKVHLQIPQSQIPDNGSAQKFSIEELQKNAADSLTSILMRVPSCVVDINDGAVHLATLEKTELSIDNIEAFAMISSERLKLRIKSRSTLWQELLIEADYARQAEESVPAGNQPALYSALLDLKFTGLDIPSCREAASALAKHEPVVQSIFSHIYSGTFNSLSCTLSLPLTADSLKKDAIVLDGRLDNATVFLPEADLVMRKLNGTIAFANGKLDGTKINGSIDNSSIHNASVSLDAGDGFSPAMIDVPFVVDFSQLPDLMRLIPPSAVRDEIELIQFPRGSAHGVCIVRKDQGVFSTEVNIDSLKLNADYRGYPAPLEITEGICRYDEGALSFEKLSGKLGTSKIPEITAKFPHNNDGFTIEAHGAVLFLTDVVSVLNSYPLTRNFFKDLQHAEGQVTVNELMLKAPLGASGKWRYRIHGKADNIILSHAVLDGPCEIKSGSLNITQDRFELRDAITTFFDCSLDGNITLDGYLSGIQKTTAEVHGRLGAVCLKKIFTFTSIPLELLPIAPLSIRSARVESLRSGVTTLTGEFDFGQDLVAELAMKVQEKSFEINKLAINDAKSRCNMSLSMSDDIMGIAYAGTLVKSTLDSVLADNQFLQGSVTGDFSAVFDEKIPLRSTATGTLSVEKAVLKGFKPLPLLINRAHVTARGSKVDIDEALITAGENSAALHGGVNFTQNGFKLDLVADADSLDLGFDNSSFSLDNATASGSSEEFWDIPLLGTITVNIGELKKGLLRCIPFHSLITFSDKKINITTTGTKLCGIKLPATVSITPENITVDASVKAKKISMREVLPCLTGSKAIISGRLDYTASLKAQGSAAELIDSLAAEVSFRARKGRIYKSTLLTRILSFLSFRNLIFGGASDITKKGFSYRSIDIKGKFKNNILTMDEFVFDASSLSLVGKGTINLQKETCDLTFLATPFEIEDLLLMSIPIVGILFSHTLIGVPINISGSIHDPKLNPGSPAAIGKGLMGVLKKIVKTPVRIIDIMEPGDPKKK